MGHKELYLRPSQLALRPALVRSRVPSRPAGRDPGRDGTGFFKGIFEKTRPIEMVQKTLRIASLILKILTYTLNTFFKTLLREISLNLKHILNGLTN